MKTISSLALIGTLTPFGVAHALNAESVFTGLTMPWGFEFIDDHRLLLNEKSGDISLLDLTQQTKTRLFQVNNLYSEGQGGLMDVKASPFKHGEYYFTYSAKVGSSGQTALAKATLQNDKLINWTPLFVSTSGSTTGYHFGSRLAFDQQFIYMSVGERGIRDNAQDLSTHAGSILRLTPQGQAPEDNPFVGQTNAKAEIWSYGHRNPQGLTYDAKTGRLWEVEHGPRGGDEINVIKPGANYGWPNVSYGKEYWGPVAVGEASEKAGVESPKLQYTPSIAPSSLILYRGERYPTLTGKLLIGALKLTHINVVSIDAKAQAHEELRLFEDLHQRIRQIAVSPNGTLYFCTDNGNLYRIIE